MAENVIITKKARENLVKARAGAIVLPKITGMAFGNGGVDADGGVITPEDGQAGLASEIFRKEISGYEFTEDTKCRYSCTLEEQECAGEDISEVGLYDENGDIACIKNFKAKGKDGDMEMTFYLEIGRAHV